MMASVDSAPFWSILDQQGSQNMMRSALGDAAKIADYETVKKRVLGSYYTMDFSSGVNFDLTVVTSDSITAGTLSMMMKAVILYKKSSATPVEKAAMDMATADSDGSKVYGALQRQRRAVSVADAFAVVCGDFEIRKAKPTTEALRHGEKPGLGAFVLQG